MFLIFLSLLSMGICPGQATLANIQLLCFVSERISASTMDFPPLLCGGIPGKGLGILHKHKSLHWWNIHSALLWVQPTEINFIAVGLLACARETLSELHAIQETCFPDLKKRYLYVWTLEFKQQVWYIYLALFKSIFNPLNVSKISAVQSLKTKPVYY